MKSNVLASTLCKIAAVFLFLTAAQGITGIALKAFILTGNLGDFLLGLLLTFVPPALAGLLLWKYSDRIGRVGEGSETANLSENVTTDTLLEAGIFLVGLYAVLFGLVDAIGVESADWMSRSMKEQLSFHEETLIRNWTRRIGYLLQLLLGVGLIYYRGVIVKKSHKIRKSV